MPPVRVAGFGDNIVDRFVDRGIAYPGGNCVNVAVFAARLGAEASYAGTVGDDEYAELILTALADEGVDTSRCQQVAGPTGLTDITVVDGDRKFLGWNDGGVTLTHPYAADAGTVDWLRGMDWVHVSCYSVVDDTVPLLAGGRALVSYDFSVESHYRTADRLAALCPSLDLALFSCGHLSPEATADLLRSAVAAGADAALGTRGVAGALLHLGVGADAGGFVSGEAVPDGEPGELLDTMACGDAFLTAFVMRILRGTWQRETGISAAAGAEALRAGALRAAEQCRVEAAFGHGRPVGDRRIAM